MLQRGRRGARYRCWAALLTVAAFPAVDQIVRSAAELTRSWESYFASGARIKSATAGAVI